MNMRLVVTFAAAFVHTSSSQKAVDSLAAVGESTPTPQPLPDGGWEADESPFLPANRYTNESNFIANHESFLPADWYSIARPQWEERWSNNAEARNLTQPTRGARSAAGDAAKAVIEKVISAINSVGSAVNCKYVDHPDNTMHTHRQRDRRSILGTGGVEVKCNLNVIDLVDVTADLFMAPCASPAATVRVDIGLLGFSWKKSVVAGTSGTVKIPGMSIYIGPAKCGGILAYNVRGNAEKFTMEFGIDFCCQAALVGGPTLCGSDVSSKLPFYFMKKTETFGYCDAAVPAQSTFSCPALWAPISSQKACESNTDGVRRKFGGFPVPVKTRSGICYTGYKDGGDLGWEACAALCRSQGCTQFSVHPVLGCRVSETPGTPCTQEPVAQRTLWKAGTVFEISSFTLDSCKLKCHNDPDCAAIDFFDSGWCNTFDEACTNPTMSSGHVVNIYKHTGSTEYCGNRGSAGGTAPYSFLKGSLALCAETVDNDDNCGRAFSYGDGMHCDCVPASMDGNCGPTSYHGYKTYLFDVVTSSAPKSYKKYTQTSLNAHTGKCEGVSATRIPGLCGSNYREYMGSLITFSQCATLCREELSCKTFSYGNAGCRISKCSTPAEKAYILKMGWGTVPDCATNKQCPYLTHSSFSSHWMYTLTATGPFLDPTTVDEVMKGTKNTAGVFMLKAGDDSTDDESESDSAVAASSATPEPNHEHEQDPILVAVLILAAVSLLSNIVLVLRGWNSAQPIANTADAAAPAGERRFDGSFDGEQMRKFSQADDFSSPRFSVSNI